MGKILKRTRFPKQRLTVPLDIILSEADSAGEYVTHMQDRSSGGRMHGHYFKELSKAEADYESRCKKLYESCFSQGLIISSSLEHYRRNPTLAAGVEMDGGPRQ